VACEDIRLTARDAVDSNHSLGSSRLRFEEILCGLHDPVMSAAISQYRIIVF
jgi:hypothetical protein